MFECFLSFFYLWDLGVRVYVAGDLMGSTLGAHGIPLQHTLFV